MIALDDFQFAVVVFAPLIGFVVAFWMTTSYMKRRSRED